MRIGRISGNVLKRSLLQQIKTKRDEVMIGAGSGADCAVFSFSEKTESDRCVTMMCAQEGFLSGGVSVSHLIRRCANVCAVRGGEPVAVSLQMLFPADAEEELVKAVMAEAEESCAALRVQIAGAGGRVAGEVTAPYVIVTGYGVCGEETLGSRHTVKAARPGQEIVLSKWIGLEGTAILAKRHRETLLERYPAWLVDEAAGFDRYLSVLEEAAVGARVGADVMQNVSEGGIFAALWELAEGAGVGLRVDLKKIPIRQETVEVCNRCGINPYELMSGGCLLMTCEDGGRLAEALETAGIPAAVVGTVTDSNDRLIMNEDETRYLDRPQTDGVYKEKY